MKNYGHPKGVRRDFWRRQSHSMTVFRLAVGEDLQTIISNQLLLHGQIEDLRHSLNHLRRDAHRIQQESKKHGVFG